MSFRLECKKIRRTGLIGAFLCGGIAAAAFPVINTAARPDTFTAMSGSPTAVLMNANYEMTALLNLLLLTAGACILYHIEFADNGIQKMQSLPLRESGMFRGKLILLLMFFLVMVLFETASLYFCGLHWLNAELSEIIKVAENLGFAVLLTLPAAVISLVIASACRNMWIVLGIGVLCIFAATQLSAGGFILTLFPYALPFHIFSGMETVQAVQCCIAAVCETVATYAAGIIYLKVRRLFA